jgi:two-component system KDP operon response regulator KdpE
MHTQCIAMGDALRNYGDCMQSARILVCDEEYGLRQLLRVLLSNAGYVVDEAESAQACLTQLAASEYALVLLDVILAGTDGVAVVQSVRALGYMMPVVMLTALNHPQTIIATLDAGADDYVIKPFDSGELLARIRAVLRRQAVNNPVIVAGGGDIVVNLHTQVVLVRNESIALTPTEYALLVTLARNVGKVVSHAELLAAVWGKESSHDHEYLKVYMWHLRRKLEPDAGRKSKYVINEWGVGYRLTI